MLLFVAYDTNDKAAPLMHVSQTNATELLKGRNLAGRNPTGANGKPREASWPVQGYMGSRNGLTPSVIG